jgi:hypothetical protein
VWEPSQRGESQRSESFGLGAGSAETARAHCERAPCPTTPDRLEIKRMQDSEGREVLTPGALEKTSPVTERPIRISRTAAPPTWIATRAAIGRSAVWDVRARSQTAWSPETVRPKLGNPN